MSMELPDGVAIIGMAGRFPQAEDIDRLWSNLVDGREGLTRFTPDELSPQVPAAVASHLRYVPVRGVLAEVARFDAAFFGISPREALLIDPQQRIFLELCWNALEHAGIDPARGGHGIGVYAGTSNNAYRRLTEARADLMRATGEFAAAIASEKDYVATRVAHKLDLRGPAVSIHTACSTSLVAVVQAWYALMSGQCEVALAGGINVALPQEAGYLPVEGGMESLDGHCRPFDADANGTVFSSGGAVVVLKRVDDAIRDGDTLYAVIRGVGLNNDGADKAGFAAPSVRGQSAAIAQALASAGVSAASIGYVEAHGTATPLGDPIEVAALERAFRADTDARQFCWLGSIKGHLGHLNAASGVAGLVKAVLALHHERIPATLHYRRPNPQIDFAASPFKVADRNIAWPRGEAPRRAGVSSFGVGGTNAHVVLEEAPARPASRPGRPAVLLPVSARDEAALARRGHALAEALHDADAAGLADAACTLALGRARLAVRGFVVAGHGAEAAPALRKLAPRALPQPPPRVVMLFPGQGAQHVAMARELVASEPVFWAAFERCCALASAALGRQLAELILPAPGDEATAATQLTQTRYAQPALFAVSYALAELWASWGIAPAAMLGHSIGEYVAACRAGVFSLEDAVALVVARGDAMQRQAPGAMLAVRASAQALAGYVSAEVEIAAHNAPELTVLAGPEAAIEACAEALQAAGIAATRLAVSHAFHSASMTAAQPLLRAALAQVALQAPTRPFYSCVTGAPITAAQATSPDYWCEQMRAPVCFADAVAHAAAAAPSLFLEAGPGQALSGLVRRRAGAAGMVVASLGPASAPGDAAAQVQRALGELWCAGIEPDWSAYFAGQARRRVALPGYPFAGEAYWVEPLPATAEPVPEASQAPAVAAAPDRRVRLAAELREVFESLSGERLQPQDDGTGFLQLGLDSLVLTQAALEIERRFGVKLKLRRLMEDLDHIAALVELLAAAAPTEAAGAPAVAAPVAEDAPADLRARPFGASARISSGHQAELTTTQRAWLADFTRAYGERTAKSKAFSQTHRARMADPRVVTGFDPRWKELTYPIVVERSQGARLWDVDGNAYIDALNGFGVNFLGYQPPFVLAAMHAQLDAGIEIGPQHPLAAEVSQLISELTGMARVALCNTGSEAVMGAMRIARTVTGRKTIAIFKDSYHGIFDEVIVRGTRTLRSIAAAPGILANAVENVLVLDYGSDEALRLIDERKHELAAVLIEPVQSRNPSLQPRGFVHALRDLCDAGGCALIFDEIITGLRMAPGGAQEFYGVRADLATYGKIIGGGLPLAAIAGDAHWLDALDGGPWQFGDDSRPEAGVTYFAGTFVRHPLALAAARAALAWVRAQGPQLQRGLNQRTTGLIARLNALFAARRAPLTALGHSSLWRIRVDEDQPCASLFWYRLRQAGIHAYEQFNCFLSLAHGEAEVDEIVAAVTAAVDDLLAHGVLSPRVGAPLELPAAVPLSEGQLEKWLACQYGDQALLAFNESGLLHLEGALDTAAFERALDQLWHRHEALRLSFDADGKTQRVHAELPLPLVQLDYRAYGDEAEARFAAYAEAQMATPFDLARAPLVRLALVRLRDDAYGFQLLSHHLVMDGWSMAVILGELATCYNAARAGQAPALPPAASFRAHVLAEHARHGADQGKTRLVYWQGLYASWPPPLALPGDRPPPARADFSASTAQHDFDANLLAALRAQAQRHGISLYGLLLAGFGLWLERLTGQRDFAIGMPYASQANEAAAAALVGDGVNTLPLRLYVDPTAPLADYLRATRTALLDATEHHDATLMSILAALGPSRRDGGAPLASVVFNLNPALPALAFDGLTPRLRDARRAALMWELFFNLNEHGDRLSLDLHYATARFDAATIARWIAVYEGILRELAAGLPASLTREATMSATPTTVLDLFAAQCRRMPMRIAVASADRTLSYAELDARASALAATLSARGIGRGDSVGVAMPRNEHLLVALLGVLKAGAAYVPLDPAFPVERLRYMAEHAQLRAVLAWQQAELPAVLRDGRVVIELAGLPATAPADDAPVAVTGEDPAYVLYTSGSTGQPKGVCVLHKNLANLLTSMREAPGLGADDVLCAVTTLSFDIAALELFLPLICGARVLLASQAQAHDPDALLRLLADGGASVLQATPALARLLLERDQAQTLRGLRLLVGGEELPRDLAPRLAERVRALWNMYGPTETTIWSTLLRVERGHHGAVPLGRPIAATTIYVLDEGGQPVADGAVGEICIGGAGVAQGYLFQPELTAERFVADRFAGEGARMYRTGDLGSWRDGLLHFHGRADQQVKLRGYRIELGELEAAALGEPGLRDAAAAVREFGHGDQRLVLYAVARADDAALAERVRARLRAQLPDYMQPQHIEWLAALPQTPNGKLDRKALPLPALAQATTTATPAPPATAPVDPREAQLAAIWRELIGVAEVRGGDNFFDLGGHSLLAVEMVARVQRDTGVRINLIDLATGTLATLAAALPAPGAAAPRAGFGARLRKLLGRD